MIIHPIVQVCVCVASIYIILFSVLGTVVIGYKVNQENKKRKSFPKYRR